jgi:hypothetical protein
MSCLYQALAQRVDVWRTAAYPCDDFPAIREILEFALEDSESGQLRYLRQPIARLAEMLCVGRLSRWGRAGLAAVAQCATCASRPSSSVPGLLPRPKREAK